MEESQEKLNAPDGAGQESVEKPVLKLSQPQLCLLGLVVLGIGFVYLWNTEGREVALEKCVPALIIVLFLFLATYLHERIKKTDKKKADWAVRLLLVLAMAIMFILSYLFVSA